MVVLCNLMLGLGDITGSLLTFFYYLILIHVILSWFNPDPNNFLVRMISGVAEPIMEPVRRRMPNFGVLDLSPIAVIFGLLLLQSVVADSLKQQGEKCLVSSTSIVDGL